MKDESVMPKCNECPLRNEARVLHKGNSESELAFVGMNPGVEEVARGLPFVGKAGKEFHRCLNRYLLITEDDCYITNVVKCFTQKNADPSPKAILCCAPLLRAELEGRKHIVALGRLAEKAIMACGFRPIYVTHPSAALRKGQWRARMIQEFKSLRRLLEGTDGIQVGPNQDATKEGPLFL